MGLTRRVGALASSPHSLWALDAFSLLFLYSLPLSTILLCPRLQAKRLVFLSHLCTWPGSNNDESPVPAKESSAVGLVDGWLMLPLVHLLSTLDIMVWLQREGTPADSQD